MSDDSTKRLNDIKARWGGMNMRPFEAIASTILSINGDKGIANCIWWSLKDVAFLLNKVEELSAGFLPSGRIVAPPLGRINALQKKLDEMRSLSKVINDILIVEDKDIFDEAPFTPDESETIVESNGEYSYINPIKRGNK